jgi:hypothetical protein
MLNLLMMLWSEPPLPNLHRKFCCQYINFSRRRATDLVKAITSAKL